MMIKRQLILLKNLEQVKVDSGELIVESEGFPLTVHQSPLIIDCGESGLSIRMFTPLAALSDKEITINGSGSLLTRPMDFFDEILPKLKVKIKSNHGKLPLVIRGPLKPANIEVDGSLSSQFLTGLLLAYSASPNPSASLRAKRSKGGASEESDDQGVSIKVRDLKSKPYIDLTLDVMKQFGMNVPENKNYEEFIFYKIFTTHQSSRATVEGLTTTQSKEIGAVALFYLLQEPLQVRS